MDIDNMDADQLKAYIIEKKEKLRKSQQKYVNRRKTEGHYRINAFITPEAAAQLERLKRETKRNVGDIISELLCDSPINNHKKTGESQHISITKKRSIATNISGDNETKSTAEKRIVELAAQGLGPSDIAKVLEKEGIRSPAGLETWRRGTVHRILKRLT